MTVWLPESLSTTAPLIDRLFYLVLGITGVVLVVVQATLVAFVVRYRRRPGRAAGYVHGNSLAEIVWTVVPALILLWLLVQSQQVWSQVRGTPPPADLEIEVTAEQFAWTIRYPGLDGRFDTSDDVSTINQMHLPVDQVVLFHLRSKDVIHSFFVPQFRLKQDVVPGITGHVWIKSTKPASVEIACAELCGLGHYRMRGFLTIESPEAFQQWLATAGAAP
jgi:cytochrome c oxidase subunit 2